MYFSILITTDALILSFYLAFSYIFSYHEENINDDRMMMWWKGRYNNIDDDDIKNDINSNDGDIDIVVMKLIW